MHVMDLYSSFIFMRKMRCTPSTEMLTTTLESIFETYGFPELIYSDSGPQMRTGFKSWAEQLGIEHRVSLAYFTSSNGAIEWSLKALKLLMKKQNFEGDGGLDEAVSILNALHETTLHYTTLHYSALKYNIGQYNRVATSY